MFANVQILVTFIFKEVSKALSIAQHLDSFNRAEHFRSEVDAIVIRVRLTASVDYVVGRRGHRLKGLSSDEPGRVPSVARCRDAVRTVLCCRVTLK